MFFTTIKCISEFAITDTRADDKDAFKNMQTYNLGVFKGQITEVA